MTGFVADQERELFVIQLLLAEQSFESLQFDLESDQLGHVLGIEILASADLIRESLEFINNIFKA